MVSVAGINGAVNSGRESLLVALENTPDGWGLKSLFYLIIVLMFIVIFFNLRKGKEERKGLIGPVSIIIFCFSVQFGFRIELIAWIIFFLLGLAMVTKLKQGEWKGVFMILIPMYFLGFIVSVKPYLMIVIAVIISVLGFVVKKANNDKIFGRGDAAKALKKEGFPINKERRLLKKLKRIAGKGFKWSKDPVVRTASKIKQRFAERALRNEAEQLREAEIVAVSEEMSKTLYQQEGQLAQLEERDMKIVEQILQLCAQLRDHLAGLPEGAVDAQKAQEIRQYSNTILKDLHLLVKNKLEEETLIEKANNILEKCMNIIHHSAHESTQLEEHKSDFKEMRKAATTNIDTLRKTIKHEIHDIDKGIAQAKHSNTQGSGERISLMKQREAGLSNVATKLADIETYIIKIDNKLIRINAEEDAKIDAVRQMSEKAEEHSKNLHKYNHLFDKEANKLEAKHKKFEHLFKDGAGMIGDVQLLAVTDNTIEMFDHLKKLTGISLEYHTKEIAPLIQEMAQVAKDISHLSKVSEYLTKMYFRLSQANEQLTKMAAQVDQNPESKNELEKVWQAEQFEEAVIKKAYRSGKGVVGHIKEGYKYLESAYGYMQKHVKALEGFDHLMKTGQSQVYTSLNSAFKKLLNQEIKQTNHMKKEAAEAERHEKQALKTEKQAKATV